METILLLGFVFLLLFVYGLFSRKLDKLSISGPMVFMVFGLVFSQQNFIEELHIEGGTLELLGKVALVAILFTDASNISLKNFFKIYKNPARLLLIGLPVTMVAGALTAQLIFPENGWVILAIMAFILSPTDAALGQAVVQSEKVPLEVRETINVESGLNDGLVLPPLLILVVMLNGDSAHLTTAELIMDVAKQLLLALVLGAAVGFTGSKLINWSVRERLVNHVFMGISIVSISIVSFVLAEHLGANGFIAAFISGLFFNADSKKTFERGQEFGEFLSQPLTLFIFFVFGAVILPQYLEYINIQVIIFSLLSLTILRILPVILSLSNSDFSLREKLFIGWFGPRGIASVLYLLMMFDLIAKEETYNPLFATICVTVCLSVFVHGLSAVPYVNWLGRSTKN